MKEDYKEEMQYKAAKKRFQKIKGFYVHLSIYLIINILIVILNVKNHDFRAGVDLWVLFTTPFFWGIGLFFHWTRVFGPNFFFGKEWEERKIKELMEKEKQEWK